MKNIEKLTPFRRLCMTIGNIPSSYIESMSDYECVLWLCKYLKEKVIPALNNNAEAVKELQNLYTDLKEYVDNYFNNLDIQEEINIKLDTMASDGTLERIINQEIFESLNEEINDIKEDVEDLTGIVNNNTLSIESINNELTTDIKYHFIGGTPEEVSGSCCIIETPKGGIIVDFGSETTGKYIEEVLDNNNITKIIGVVLTHYHLDHVGGLNANALQNVLSDTKYDITECKAYLPHNNIEWNRCIGDLTNIETTEDLVKGFLNRNNIDIIYPTENRSYELTEYLVCYFNNLSTDKFDDYYEYTLNASGKETDPSTTNYNNFSMICSFINNKHKVTITGDIEKPAEENNFEVIQNAEVLTVEHHGTNHVSSDRYINNISPKILIIPTGELYHETYWLLKDTTSKAIMGGAKAYNTADSHIVTITSSISDINSYSENGISAFTNVDLGLNWGTKIANESDLDDITTIGVYNIQNATDASTIEHTPFTNTGYKLIVMQSSESLAMIQMAIGNTSVGVPIAVRRTPGFDSGIAWTPWKYLNPSPYYYKLITNDILTGATIRNNSFNQNHIAVQNGFIEVSLDINTTQELVTENTILSFNISTYGRGTYFTLFDPVNKVNYLFRISYTSATGEHKVIAMETIPTNTRLVGSVTLGLYTFNNVG